MRLLLRLIDKEASWQWTWKHDHVFQEIKQLVAKAPVLKFYYASEDFTIECDTIQHVILFNTRHESEPKVAQGHVSTVHFVVAMEKITNSWYQTFHNR